jgi:hypothetical protein
VEFYLLRLERVTQCCRGGHGILIVSEAMSATVGNASEVHYMGTSMLATVSHGSMAWLLLGFPIISSCLILHHLYYRLKKIVSLDIS